jgi:hypothetical protein
MYSICSWFCVCLRNIVKYIAIKNAPTIVISIVYSRANMKYSIMICDFVAAITQHHRKSLSSLVQVFLQYWHIPYATTIIDLLSPYGKFDEKLLTHLINEGPHRQQRAKPHEANDINDATRKHYKSLTRFINKLYLFGVSVFSCLYFQ